MSNYTTQNIDFARQTLLKKMNRGQPVIALYPENSQDTNLQLLISNNGTSIVLKYISSTTTTETITYTGKSVAQVVADINQLTIPIRAVLLSNIDVLSTGDILGYGSNYIGIPDGFSVYDRLPASGIVVRSTKVPVKHKTDSKIKILSPYSEDPSLPWYPRILNGSFTQVYNNKVYHYYIPEFDNQSWSSVYGKPFKELFGIVPIQIDKNTYKLPRTPVYWNGENLVIYNGDVPVSANIIEDIDTINGILYIKPEYSIDKFSIDYIYLENSFIYPYININGHFGQNPLILSKYVVVYMIPVEGSTTSTKRTVYHVIGDSIDQAIDSIIPPTPETPIAIIGAYSIQQIYNSDKVSILDTRVKGGGLKELTGPTSPIFKHDRIIVSDGTPIEDKYSEAYRFWDIGNYDGDPYPGAAAITIDLPLELMEALPISDIKAKATKFAAAGIYPVIKFSDRELPDVDNYSAQVSCFVNGDLSTTYQFTDTDQPLYTTIPSVISGGGWNYTSRQVPTSVYTGDLSDFDNPIHVVKRSHNVLGVNGTGVYQSYLKGVGIAGISWEERMIYINTGDMDSTKFSQWQKKQTYDTRFTVTGELIKGYVTFPDTNVQKEYRNIKVNSPYRSETPLKELIYDNISSIIDGIVALQPLSGGVPNSTDIRFAYKTLDDTSDVDTAVDYLGFPYVYNAFYEMNQTDIADKYCTLLSNIGSDVLAYGIDTGSFFNYYIQNLGTYTGLLQSTYSGLYYNDSLKMLNKYLDYRNANYIWSGDCTLGLNVSTGLLSKMMSSSGTYGEFGPGVPLVWTYDPTDGSLSGRTIHYSTGIGGSLTEILLNYNYDIYYNTTLPALYSCALGHTGTVSTRVGSHLKNAYDITVAATIDNIDTALNGARTVSGLNTVNTHWAATFGRHTSYLGTTLFNLIESYDYLYRYLDKQYVDNVTTVTGASYIDLRRIFSGIERVLDAGYAGLTSNLLRGGIVESDVAYALYGYGWYINNWPNHYGLVGKTYDVPYVDKYETLFDDGLKTYIKSNFNSTNDFFETTSIEGEPGPFRLSTPTKFLLPLSEALKIDESWNGIAQGTITTLSNHYGVDGLYYANPLKTDTTPGKEYDVLYGLAKCYSSIASTGAKIRWEPMGTGLSNMRAVNYIPVYSGHTANPPETYWAGVQNAMSIWKYYRADDVNSELALLTGNGINAVKIPIDYTFWYKSGSTLYNNMDNFFDLCSDHKLRVIPSLVQNYGSELTTSIDNYLNVYGYSGGWKASTTVYQADFLTGTSSGLSYLSGIVNRYDKHPALCAWEIVDYALPSASGQSRTNNLVHIVNELTTTPLIVGMADKFKYQDIYPDAVSNYYTDSNDIYTSTATLYNPNIDFIGIKPPSIFGNAIDTYTSMITKPVILSDLGDAMYGDYSVAIQNAIDRGIPFILNNILIPDSTGSFYGRTNGIFYSDGTARSSRQAQSLVNAAQFFGRDTVASIDQRYNFTNVLFYPSGYVPSYDAENLFSEISYWQNRQYPTALTQGNTGEFRRQLSILDYVQSGLDRLHAYQSSDYEIGLMSFTESQDLNYYRNTWTSGNFISNPSNRWTTGDNILDVERYDQFFTDWGRTLGTIINRLNLNG